MTEEDYSGIREITETKLKGHHRHCLRNAFRHLDAFEAVGPEHGYLGAFALITAEEEASSAVVYALQCRKYPVDGVQPTKHPHKTAIRLMGQAIFANFCEMSQAGFRVVWGFDKKSKKARCQTRVTYRGLGYVPTHMEHTLIEAPLDFQFDDGDIKSFRIQLEKMMRASGHDNLEEFLKYRTNKRNELLYATPGGVAHVDDAELARYAAQTRAYVCACAFVVISILQTKVKQPILLQLIEAFNELIDHLRRHRKN